MEASVCTFLLLWAVSFPALARGEDPKQWFRDGRAAVERAMRLAPISHRARNVILFIGDGMGVSTVTAARILEGQLRGETGEENRLSFEKLPYTALIKTYNTNQQTPDSAGTMTAIVTGVKTQAWMLSVSQNVTLGDHTTVEGNELTTILELAERAGLSTGLVTTATVTHATPAACFAHSPSRQWEDDSMMSSAAVASGFPDIARQLIEFDIGDGLEVALGGGRRHFLPRSLNDPERKGVTGRRKDGRDLTAEWLEKPRSAYVWNKEQFDKVDVSKTDHLLGLFSPGYMAYEVDRADDKAGEPSLTEMTEKAIDLLAGKKKGYFLMVEGGRIDHGHHRTNAYRALTETIEFAKAVKLAVEKTNRQDTLIIVTADHSHGMTMTGYSTRGNPILGKVRTNDRRGKPAGRDETDATGRPYTTLNYAIGPGYTGASSAQPEGSKHSPHPARRFEGITKGRPDLSNVDTTDPSYLFECTIPRSDAAHGGEDVALYADGPYAHLFRGSLEQNVIFHVMAEALGLVGTNDKTDTGTTK